MTSLDLRAASLPHRPDLAGSPPELAAAAIGTWKARMVNEYSSSEVFEALSRQLEGAGEDGDLVAECRAFAAEERRHGALCGAVVEALGGQATAVLPARSAFPVHPDASARAALVRNVIHVCCMSETVAVALIGAERLEMPDGPLRELLTRIYADEVGHARYGWRLLERIAGDLDDSERDDICPWRSRISKPTSSHTFRTATRLGTVRHSVCAAAGKRGSSSTRRSKR
jgi:hypothetical protein